MSAPVLETPDINLRVKFDFEYKTKDDRKICIREGEKLFLIKKTNPDWWQVIRSSKERPFYVPATYVEESSFGNIIKSQAKTSTQSAELKLQTRPNRKSEPNGNVLSKHFERTNPSQQNFNSSQENVSSGKLFGQINESVSSKKKSEDSPEAKRILFDKRKSWAVEELMLELTQKRDIKPATTPEPTMPTAPEPEPEPDYANIYRDEHGIHIITDTDSTLPGTHFTSSPSNLDGSTKLTNLTVPAPLSDNAKKDIVKPNILSKQALSKPEVPIDKTLSLVNNMQSSGVTSLDKVAVEDSNTLTSLSPKENGGSIPALDTLKGTANDLAITRSVSTHSLLTQKRRDYEAKVSIVSLDGINNALGLETRDDGSYSTVAVAKDIDSEKRYSKVSIVRKDSSRSLKDISGSISKEFSKNDDIAMSQRLNKDPKLSLSDSLEKLAQQIQFGPAVISESTGATCWKTNQSRSFEEELHSDVTNLPYVESATNNFDVCNFKHNINLNTDEKLQTYPNKMFKKVQNKLHYSSSFKTKKEMEKNMRKNYSFGTENLDHRASVSGEVHFDPNFSDVFNVAKNGSDSFVGELDMESAAIPDNHQELRNIPEQHQDYDGDLPLNSFGKPVPIPSPSHRSPKENLAVIGEATILLDHFTYDEEHTSTHSKVFPSKENLSKIAHGFLNPSYRSISHSLDSFHDPKVLAMHDALCTDLSEQQKLKQEKESSESLQGSQLIEKLPKPSSVQQVVESQGASDPKLRNFQKLRNAIEESDYGYNKEGSGGKPLNIISDKNLVARNVVAFNDFQKFKIGSIEDGKYVDKAFEGMYDSHSDLKSSRSSSKASLDGDKVMKKHSSKSSLDELVSNFESRSLSKSNSSLNQRKPNGSDGNRSRSDSNTSDDTILQGPENKRRTSLSRGNRVESIKERHQLIVPARPPSPQSSERPVRYLHDGWAEYRTHDGRTYYYSHAGGKSWKPPRKNKLSDTEDGSTSSLLCPDLELPPGWTESVDDNSGERCYVHQSRRGGKWFSSYNDEHKIYFFEENSNESSWTLPDIPDAPSNDAKPAEPLITNAKLSVARLTKLIDADQEEAILRGQRGNQPHRLTKAMSMVMVPTNRPEDRSPTSVTQNWPHLFDGNMVIIIEKFLREGPLHRTKITEHGKKVRKNWSSSYVVLSELFLLFFHDHKHAQALKNGDNSNLHPPEFSIDLSGARIERGDKLSRRKNVFVITAQFELQVLIQSDSSKTAEEWFHLINTQIALLPGKCDSIPRINTSPEETKKSTKLGRSRSVKLKRAEGSMEDLTATPEERQTKIRARLKKFFIRRPTKDALVKKGIYKDEPMFGRNLADVVTSDGKGVPVFVTRCIAAIERKSENMKADGLYRVSGNLSQVQKIRLQADQNNLTMLEEEEDVHVLTGALKLFFRELKTPLIPSDHFSKAIKASSNRLKKERTQQFREIVKALPSTNRETLKCILQHLLRVSEFEESNRMNLPNLAIVFGPTLMWPEEESANMAIDLMQQNLVIECLLIDYDSIFR